MTQRVLLPSSYLPRLLLAALLLFGSEILFWLNPDGRPIADWLLLIPGYIVISALLLDLLARFRVRDLFGALILTGLYGLLASLLLNPQTAFADMPRTFITRVVGAHALLGLEMFGLFLALTGGERPSLRRSLFIGCLFIGLSWGFWVRWWPPDAGYGLVTLPMVLAYGAAGLLLIVVLLFASVRVTLLTVDDLRLSRRGWSVVLIVLLALAAVRLLRTELPVEPSLLALLLIGLCLVMLWFRRRAGGRTLLDGHIPVVPPPLITLLLAAALFLVSAVAAYQLPLIEVAGVNQLLLIGVGFTAYGVAWLPAVSLALGLQAYLRQIQKRQL